MNDSLTANPPSNPQVADLSFVTFRNGKCDMWTPERPADRAQAIEMGKDYAREMLVMIRETDNPLIFGAVIRTMTSNGLWGPVEMGFCSVLGIELLGAFSL